MGSQQVVGQDQAITGRDWFDLMKNIGVPRDRVSEMRNCKSLRGLPGYMRLTKVRGAGALDDRLFTVVCEDNIASLMFGR